jgi:tetratricopeptide (TPR) repeat protein/capsular polysaccharide biosynthesis protein
MSSWESDPIAARPTEKCTLWHLGLEWLLRGEVEQAQAVWLDALTEAPIAEIADWMAELLQVLESEAVQQFAAGHYLLTEQICQQILELDAEQAAAHFLFGQAIAQRGDFDAAIACWQQAAALDPTLVEAYQQQGSVLQKLDQLEQAISCYASVLALQPDRVETLYHLGLCRFQQGKADEAIAHFTAAIQLNSDDSRIYGDRGYAHLQQGHFNEAIVDLQQAIRLQQSFVQTYINWQLSFVQHHQSSEQINANANLLQSLRSIDSNLFLQLGNALVAADLFSSKGRAKIAITAYQQALSLQLDAQTYLKLGRILKMQGNRDQACVAFQDALQLQPSADAHLCLGEIYLLKDVQQGISILQTALKLDSCSASAYFLLGEAWSRLQQWQQAIDCYQKYLQLKPDSIQGGIRLGLALAMQDHAAAAIDCWQQGVSQYPDDAAILLPSTLARLRDYGKEIQHPNLKQLEPVDAPTAFYESTHAWAIAHSMATTHYVQLDVRNTIALTPPKTLDQTTHFSFRFGQAIELPGNFVATIPKGRFWLNQEQTSSAVIAGDNKFLADLSPDYPILSPGHPDKHPSQHSILKLKKLPPIQQIAGTVAVLSGLTNDLYFHWMFDILPRISLLKRSNLDFAQIDRFLVRDRLSFQQETLQTLGIPAEKILRDTHISHIQAENLMVPSYPGSVAWMPKWTCDFLRSSFLTSEAVAEARSIDRLYISRQQTASRRLINEAAVVDLLTQFEFQPVTLETLSVTQQAAVLANAKVVVAPHGGGLTNLVFCQPGTKVIELFSPNYVYPCYWLVSNLVELEYYYLIGEMPLGVHFHQLLYADPRVEDIYIDLQQLMNILEFAGVI